jgi:cardiolipin synthase
VVALVGREVLLAGVLWWIKRYGQTGLPVHFVGKAATFNLLYAFPLLLLGDGDGAVAELALVFGWAFAIWGIGLYWWAGLLYAWQVRTLLTTTARPARKAGRRVDAR